MNGTIRERLVALAQFLVGYADRPTEADWERFGFDPENSIIGDVEGDSREDWDEFDEHAMRCNSCDWWYHPDALDEEGNCGDCQE